MQVISYMLIYKSARTHTWNSELRPSIADIERKTQVLHENKASEKKQTSQNVDDVYDVSCVLWRYVIRPLFSYIGSNIPNLHDYNLIYVLCVGGALEDRAVRSSRRTERRVREWGKSCLLLERVVCSWGRVVCSRERVVCSWEKVICSWERIAWP